MSKLKALLSKLLTDIRTADYKDPIVLIATLMFLAVPVLVGKVAYDVGSKPHGDLRAASVKITNRAANSGGTGIIISSGKSESSILTNDHVCRLVKKAGGFVLTMDSQYQVVSIIESELSDLCLVQVADNLGVNTVISPTAPKYYDQAIVAGHPALMPNVISTGHVSGRTVIQVMTGMKPCTEEDLKDPNLILACAFLGGLPVVKSYESVLVTATIMPGSSGSGVYNTKEELNGVVFAGSSEFGYAWTVPYEQVLNFLFKEHASLKKQNISQEIDLFGKEDESKRTKELLQKCNTATDEVVVNFCKIIKRDVIWRE